MKCPHCNYHSLPGAALCGLCGKSLAVEEQAPRVADIYPPRARSRTALQQAEACIGRPARQARGAAGEGRAMALLAFRLARSQAEASREQLRWWSQPDNLRQVWSRIAAPLASAVPGLGQLLQRRYLRAAVLIAAGIPAFWYLCWAATVTIMVSNDGLGLQSWRTAMSLYAAPAVFGVLMWISVWEAAWHSFPQPEAGEAGGRHAARLGLLSLSYSGIALSLLLMWLQRGQW